MVFPDQKEHVTGLGAFDINSAGSLSHVMQQPPILTLCFLCLLGPIVKKQQEHILMDTGNHTKLIEMAQEHKDEYKIPPSPAWLCQEFLVRNERTKRKKPSGVEEKIRSEPPTGLGGGGIVEVGSRKPISSRWYETVLAKSVSVRCKCSGNCHSNCPGRTSNCTNVALDPPQLMLCEACKCRANGCTQSARRPWGDMNFSENKGFCKRHWPKRN